MIFRLPILGLNDLNFPVDGQILSYNAAQDQFEWAYEAYVYVRDKKAQNTPGGTFTQDAWQTRNINEEVADTGNNCSIAGNQITLEVGTYRCSIFAPGYKVDRHQAKLYNITDTADEIIGTSNYSDVANNVQTVSIVVGRFTITAQKTFEIQHQCVATQNGNGFGVECNFTDEIYTVAEFWKEI